ERLQVAAILSVVTPGDVNEDVECGSRLLIAQRQRDFAANARVSIFREARGDGKDVEIGAPHRAIRRDPQHRIGKRLGRSRALTAFGTKLIEQVDRAAAYI